MNRRRRAQYLSIRPGLTNDAAELCLSRVPRSCIRPLALVCRRWRSFVHSEGFAVVRKSVGVVEDFPCILMQNEGSDVVSWEVFDSSGKKLGQIPPVLGPARRNNGVAVLGGGKIVSIARFTVVRDPEIYYTLADVYDFDPGVNRWRKLADLNVPCNGCACAKVDGLLWIMRGDSSYSLSLFSAEVYNPETNKWSFVKCPIRNGVRNSFAFSFNSKLHDTGHGSGFINVRDLNMQTSDELNTRQSLAACSYTFLRNKVYIIDDFGNGLGGSLGMFDLAANSWSPVFVPYERGGMRLSLGVWNNKVLLFFLHPWISERNVQPKQRDGFKMEGVEAVKPLRL